MYKIIEDFEHDLKEGGFNKYYLDPFNTPRDMDYLLGKRVQGLCRGYYNYIEIDRIDYCPEYRSVEILIYRDVLEKFEEFVNFNLDD